MKIPVFVRSSGERTTELCLHSVVAAGFPAGCLNIFDNTGKAFWNVLVRSLKAAADSLESHVLVIDADVVMFPNACELISACIESRPQFARIEFQRICKFTTKTRGIHLYNVRRLQNEIIPELSRVPEDHLKPESELIRRLYLRGVADVQHTGPTVAWHDFEQYFAHIYAKMALRAMRDPIMHDVLRIRASQHPSDADYAVALSGFRDGLRLGREALNHPRRSYDDKPALARIPAVYAGLALTARAPRSAPTGGEAYGREQNRAQALR